MTTYNINLPLFLNSTTSGLVIPRVSSSQKSSIIPQQGMILYETTNQSLQYYNGTTWVDTGYSSTGSNNISALTDAFGRLRTSNPFTLFDSSFRYKDNGKFDTKITGLATGTFDNLNSCYTMTVSGNGDSIIRESYRVFPYQPGKSLEILSTALFDQNSYTSLNLTQRLGYYNSTNGIYLEVSNGIVKFCIKKNGTINSVDQQNWNIDHLDGSGPSGYTLDITKNQIFYSDIEWLGVGTVKLGFVINGQIITAHCFHHANITQNVYMQTATLPIKYEIISTGNSGSMNQICSTVISEGGYQGKSEKHNISNGITNVNVGSTWTPLVSIRMKSGRTDSIVLPAQTDIFVTSADSIQYQLVINPGFSVTPSWTSAGNDSNVEYSSSAATLDFTNARIVDVGYGSSSNQTKSVLTTNGIEEFNVQLGRTIDGVSDIVTLCARSFSGTATLVWNFAWYELN